MKAIVLLLGTFVPFMSTAAVIGYAPGPAGRLELHDAPEMCAAPALYAEWVPSVGDRVRGCWLAAGGQVRAVFLDGDVVTLSVGSFMRPTKT